MTGTLRLKTKCRLKTRTKLLNPYPHGFMTDDSSFEIIRLLVDWGNSDQAALERLLPLVEQELHRPAHNYMRRENPDHTLQTTALVNAGRTERTSLRSLPGSCAGYFRTTDVTAIVRSVAESSPGFTFRGSARRTQEPSRRVEIFRRPGHRWNGRGVESIADNGHARLEVCAGVVVTRDRE